MKNRQEFDMQEEELQCTDPRCRRIFAHKAHTDTDQPYIRREREDYGRQD